MNTQTLNEISCAGRATSRAMAASVLAVPVALLLTSALQAAEAELEEIIVTATKREANLRDVPIAITAFSASDLAERSAYKLTDITTGVPNMAISEGNNTENSTSFTIRGLTTTFNNPGISPGVGIYVDGIYLARNAVFDSALSDIERVEVLKGPQGTLFGRNTIQGAINVVTQKPGDDFRAGIGATVGNYDLRQLQGQVSGPVSENGVSASLSAYVRERDGTVDDVAQGRTLNGQDYYGGRAKLRFRPDDHWDITLSVDGHRDDTSSQTTDQYPIDYVVRQSGVLDGQPQVFKRDIFGGSVEVEYDAENYTFVSLSGVRTFDHTFANDQDFIEARLLDSTSRDESANWASQEFRILSKNTTTFDWLVGAYLYTQDSDSSVNLLLGPDFGPPLFAEIIAGQSIDSYALFANADWHVSDRLTVNLGLRFTWEDQTFDFEQSSDFIPTIPQFRQQIDSTEPSPTIGLVYALSDDLNAYLKYARGFKSGGFNNTAAFGSAAEITAVRPEFVDSYEAGLKGAVLDNRVQFGFAAFYLEYKDRQVSTFVNPLVGFAFANAATSSSSGAEFDVSALATDNLLIRFAVGYNDGEYDKFADCAGPGTDCSGDPLGTPNLNVMASLDYNRELANGMSFIGRVDGYYQDEPDVAPNPDVVPPDERTIVNARFGIQSTSGWGVALWGRNLTEDDGTIYSTSFIGELTGGLPEPRTYGVEVSYQFD